MAGQQVNDGQARQYMEHRKQGFAVGTAAARRGSAGRRGTGWRPVVVCRRRSGSRAGAGGRTGLRAVAVLTSKVASTRWPSASTPSSTPAASPTRRHRPSSSPSASPASSTWHPRAGRHVGLLRRARADGSWHRPFLDQLAHANPLPALTPFPSLPIVPFTSTGVSS